MNSLISELPSYCGEAWRADSGYRHRSDVSAADVIRFEKEDLGNSWPDSIPPKLLRELENYPAHDLMWVGRTRESCRIYGEPWPIELSSNARVIYEDEDGTLVLNEAASNL